MNESLSRRRRERRPLVGLSVVVAALALAAASCGGSKSSGTTSASATTVTVAPSTTAGAPVTSTSTTVVSTAGSTPTSADLQALLAANTQPGKLTHFTMKRSADGSPETTEEAWISPERSLVRYQHPSDTPGAAPVVEVYGLDTARLDAPIGPMVVLAAPSGMTPPPLRFRTDQLDGRPVSVVTWEVPASDDNATTTFTLVFDADAHLLTETRASEGTTTRISYTTDFLDPASLPADAFDVPPSPEDTAVPAPVEQTPEALTAEAERAVKLGLDLRWLGTSSGGWKLTDLMVDTGTSFQGVPLSASLIYEPSPPSGVSVGALQIGATSPASWPAYRQMRPDLASIETTGKPVPGVGQRAFVLTNAAPAATQSTMVVFYDDLVMQLDQFGFGAQPADVEASLIAAAKDLHPVREG